MCGDVKQKPENQETLKATEDGGEKKKTKNKKTENCGRALVLYHFRYFGDRGFEEAREKF